MPKSSAGPAVFLRLEKRMSQSPAVHGIYRYPVKGLSAEALEHTILRADGTLPGDRRYAIENGPCGFDPAQPKYFPKIRFLMLMRNERLAQLQTRFDDNSHVLTIRHNNAEAARGNLEEADGRATIENFFAANFARELRAPPKVLSAAGHSFSDVAAKVVSIINLASVAAIEDFSGLAIDPLRFRGNLYVSGWPAWHEFDLMNRTIAIGKTRLKIIKRIVRCAAVNVDPVTGERDMNIPHVLARWAGHEDCGVYATVIAGGEIAAGDRISVLS